MAALPEPKKPETNRKFNKDILLAVLYVIFVIAAIGGMMALDYFGEAKMGNAAKVHDAADDH